MSGYNESERKNRNGDYLKAMESLKNPDNIGPGSIIMLSNPDNLDGSKAGWVGHAAIVVSREYDANGNVVGVLTLQGHTNGVSTELEYIGFDSSCDANKHISAYVGQLHGIYEIGASQTCAK